MRKARLFKRILAVTAALAALGTIWVFAKDTETGTAPYNINIYSQNFTPMTVNVVSETGNLVFSDSPEYVDKHGILSAGTVQGDSRVYFYHVNEMKDPQKVAIVFENKGAQDNHITITRKIMSLPSDEYFGVGRELSRKELRIHATEPVQFTMTPGTRQQVYNELDKVKVGTDELFTGIMDFTSTQPVYVRVMMLDPKDSVVGSSYSSPILPMDDVELRGTYVGSHRVLNTATAYDPRQGGASIQIGDDKGDRYLSGIDELSGNMTVRDKGNYGVDYNLHIDTVGNQLYDVYFNPLGGGYAGAIKLTNQMTSQIVDVPKSYQESLGRGTVMDTQLLGTFMSGTPLDITFMPAGASNLPFRFLLTPHVDAQVVKAKEAEQQPKDSVKAKSKNKKESAKVKNKNKNKKDENTSVAPHKVDLLGSLRNPSGSSANDNSSTSYQPSSYSTSSSDTTQKSDSSIPEAQTFTVVKEGSSSSTSVGQPINRTSSVQTNTVSPTYSSNSTTDDSVPLDSNPYFSGVPNSAEVDNTVPITSALQPDNSNTNNNGNTTISIGTPLK